MMLGWSRKVWIFSSRMNCVSRLSCTIFFLFIIFKATIMPVFRSLARLTVPNLPSPRVLIILNDSLLSPLEASLSLSGDFVWFRIKEGNIFSDLCPTRWSGEGVIFEDAVYLMSSRWLALPPEFLALNNYGWPELTFLKLAFLTQVCVLCSSTGVLGLRALDGLGLNLLNS